jgi:hypothetical protein
MSDAGSRAEMLIAMGARLCDALVADIAALEKGLVHNLKSADPEIERLSAAYGQGVKALKTLGVKTVAKHIVAALKETNTRLTQLLTQHERLLAAMREATEGLVQAVAAEAGKARKQITPYGPKSTARPSSAAPIVYNSVV